MSVPIIPWIGGKRRLAKHLLPLFPRHQCYVEPFCGAAALFFLKQPSDVEVLNDINGDLVNLYRVVKHHLEEFVRQFKWALSSREIFKWLQATPPETMTDIQRAARFFYLQRLCFNGKIESQVFAVDVQAPPAINLLRLEEELSAAHLRLSRAYIEDRHWSDCVQRLDRPDTFFFMDPPYWGTEGYGVPFPIEEYSAIAAAMRSLKGKALLTVNDHRDMREAFAGLQPQEADITYMVGGGDRLADRRELIVFSWDVEREPPEGRLL